MKKIISLIMILLISLTVGCSQSDKGDLSVIINIIGHDKEEYILKDYEVNVKENTTADTALAMACKENRIPVSMTGVGKTVYIEGINNIFEFDHGSESGWLYRINGIFPDKSAGAVTVNDGDKMDWVYTKELGRDWR